MTQRLNKYLAYNLGFSRREADNLISSGAVIVGGTVAALGSRVTDGQVVSVNGKLVTTKQQATYIMLNKPVGYVSSRKQQGAAPTLYDLLPSELHSLKTVGRLDKDSSGLILLTDDGDFTQSMTHPRFYKVKTYQVSLHKALEPLHQQMISDFGIALEDGPSRLGLECLNDDRQQWLVTMHEGRNRQIRRTFAALGYNVTKLHRISFGSYQLGDLQPGDYRSVS